MCISMLIHDNIGIYVVDKLVEINFMEEWLFQQESTSEMNNRQPK